MCGKGRVDETIAVQAHGVRKFRRQRGSREEGNGDAHVPRKGDGKSRKWQGRVNNIVLRSGME